MAGLAEGFSTGFGLGLQKRKMDEDAAERAKRLEREAKLDRRQEKLDAQGNIRWESEFALREAADRRASEADARSGELHGFAVDKAKYEQGPGRKMEEEKHKLGLKATNAGIAASTESAAASRARRIRDEAEAKREDTLRILYADQQRLMGYDEEFTKNPQAMDDALVASAMLSGESTPDMNILLRTANVVARNELSTGVGPIEKGKYAGWEREPAKITGVKLNDKKDGYGTITVDVPIVNPKTGERKILRDEPITLGRSLDDDDGIADIDLNKFKDAIDQAANVAFLAKEKGVPPSRVANELNARIAAAGGDPNKFNPRQWSDTRGGFINKGSGKFEQVVEPLRLDANEASLQRYAESLRRADYDEPEIDRMVEAKRAEMGKPSLGNSGAAPKKEAPQLTGDPLVDKYLK